MMLLVVESEPKAAAYLRRGLAEEGYTVEVAHSGVDGLYMASVSEYDLVILDSMLPGIDGLAILAALRQTRAVLVVASINFARHTDCPTSGGQFTC